MTPGDMQRRIKAYALRIIKLVSAFPKTAAGEVIGKQLIRAGTGSAANYRSACIARSRRDFINKLGIVEEEADESVFWIDFATDAGLTRQDLVADLLKEGQAILAMIVASRKTAKVKLALAKKPETKNQT